MSSFLSTEDDLRDLTGRLLFLNDFCVYSNILVHFNFRHLAKDFIVGIYYNNSGVFHGRNLFCGGMEKDQAHGIRLPTSVLVIWSHEVHLC